MSDKPPPIEPDQGPNGSANEEGLSLDRLAGAFAQMLRTGSEPADEEEADDPLPLASQTEEGGVSPATLVEAMLFVGHPENRPLTTRQVASLVRGVEPDEVGPLVDQLNEGYQADGCPYEIVGEADGFRLVLRKEFVRIRDKFYGRTKEARLTQAAVEVLAIVAYNQPITREEINQQRGKSSGVLLSHLVRRQLLSLERTEQKPRITRYRTTDRFLTLFRLRHLNELPRGQPLDQ